MKPKYAQWLVDSIESLTPEQWTKLRNHSRYMAFMDEYFTAKCVVDFWTYLWHFTYFRNQKHYWPDFHRRMAEYLCGWKKPVLGVDGRVHGWNPVNVAFLVCARELCKTQMAIAWLSWEYVRDQNLRTLIRAFKDERAEEILGAFKEIVTEERWRNRFVWVRPKGRGVYLSSGRGGMTEGWRQKRITFDREDTGIRTPSVEACGLGSDPTGGHFHRCLCDDLEVRENAQSEDLRGRLLERFQEDQNLLMAGHRRLVLGTPWWKGALIDSALRGLGRFEEMEYLLFEQPATVRMFEGREWQGTGEGTAVLLGDRQTVKVLDTGLAGFPSGRKGGYGDNLEYCQARMLFWSDAAKDTVEEIREIEWNDWRSFRVNRPIPAVMGRLLGWVVGGDKPAAPNRHTLDSVDLLPPEGKESEVIARKSLVQAEREQGPFVYSCQMKLKVKDPAQMLLNPELLVPLAEGDYPEGPRFWFRAVDLATSKKTSASTSIMTGFHCAKGFVIDHLVYENQMKPTDVLLELFEGVLRVRARGGELFFTTFEDAILEAQLQDQLEEAERDVYKYFHDKGGMYRVRAEDFAQKPGLHIKRRILSRSQYETKNLRIFSVQPWLAGGKIFYRQDMRNARVLVDQLEEFRLERNLPSDALDNLADLIREGYPPPETKPKESSKERMTQLQAMQLRAARRLQINRYGKVSGWRPTGK